MILKPKKFLLSNQTYGFGYDNISRDNYKILWFKKDGFINEHNLTFEIYEFNSDSWRTLDAPLDWALSHTGRGVSVKGNMYWIADSKHMSKKCIQCFDFSTETFKSICLFPYDIDKETCDIVVLSAYRNDKLSLLRRRSKPDQPCNIEVWITNNVKDRDVSWIKLFDLSRPDLPIWCPSDFSRFIHYFIDKNNMINAMPSELGNLDTNGNLCIFPKIHIIGKDGFQTKDIGRQTLVATWGFEHLINGYVYFPSLVMVP